MLESIFTLFLTVIFVSIVLSVRTQRHVEELTQVIDNLEAQGAQLESFIKDTFEIGSIEDALAQLTTAKAALTQMLYKITENL
jgi:hypothetical protein